MIRFIAVTAVGAGAALYWWKHEQTQKEQAKPQLEEYDFGE